MKKKALRKKAGCSDHPSPLVLRSHGSCRKGLRGVGVLIFPILSVKYMSLFMLEAKRLVLTEH